MTICCPVLDEDHPVYGIKTVHAIPLSEERARAAVNALLSRNSKNPRPSLLPTTNDVIGPKDSPTRPQVSARAVKFAEGGTIKAIPLAPQQDGLFAGLEDNYTYSPSSSSGRSSPGSELSQTGPVEQTIASRLAFWDRFSKRSKLDEFGDSYPVDDPTLSLDTVLEDGRQEPAEALGDIIATVAPAPATQEETNNQLEDKIVRETIREFSKGGMYFAYNFGRWFGVHIYSVR